MGIAFALIAFFGTYKIIRQYPQHWAQLIPSNAIAKDGLERAIDAVSDDFGLQSGIVLPLANFVQTGGNRIRVVLVEGHFFDRAIEPQSTWRFLANNILLVSSVDEKLSDIGNLSSPITAGCAIKPGAFTQNLGSTSIEACRGIYKSRFNISYLARISVIVNSTNEDKSPCWDQYGITGVEGDYQTCVGNAVAQGLNELFIGMFSNESIDAVVMPAIATGVGKLSKSAFYSKLLTEVLLPQLSRENYIPETIYLQVWRGDPDRRWNETKKAIAGAVANAVNTWEYRTEHKIPESEWLSLTGVAIGGLLILILQAFGARFDGHSDFALNITSLRPLLILSWISMVVGLVSMFKAFFGLFPASLNPYLQVFAGIATALFSGPITRADEKLRTNIKDTKTN